MGRKKKHFIDKKSSVTFSLVHRSQKDPLIDEENSSQMVLADQSSLSRDQQLKEQEKYGILYKDEYNYLQHLKDSSSTQSVQLEATKNKITSSLPSELFGHEVNTVGTSLDKVTPLKGPQLGWDPDIIAALDEEEGEEEEEEEREMLEDDFILLANGGEPGLPVYVSEQDMKGGEEQSSVPWWLERGHYYTNTAIEEEEGEGEESEGDDDRLYCFTNYSMTSADIPRSDGLSALDERFERFMLEYDDNQIGPLEEEEEEREEERGEGEERINEVQSHILESALSEFNHKHRNLAKKLTKDLEDPSTKEQLLVNDSEEEKEELFFEEFGGKAREWDCESILSTYSNLYNHPTLIKEPERTRKRSERSNSSSQFSDQTMEVSAVPLSANTIRPKNELPEDRKIRKKALKEERRVRRANKKTKRELFKIEELELNKQLINNNQQRNIPL